VILERSELIIFIVLKVLFISFMCFLIGGRIELLWSVSEKSVVGELSVICISVGSSSCFLMCGRGL